jgi:hypothetical protein
MLAYEAHKSLGRIEASSDSFRRAWRGFGDSALPSRWGESEDRVLEATIVEIHWATGS